MAKQRRRRPKSTCELLVTVKFPFVTTARSEVALKQANIDAVFAAIDADKTIDLASVCENPYIGAVHVTFVWTTDKYNIEVAYGGEWVVFPLDGVEVHRNDEVGDAVLPRDAAIANGENLMSLIQFLTAPTPAEATS